MLESERSEPNPTVGVRLRHSSWTGLDQTSLRQVPRDGIVVSAVRASPRVANDDTQRSLSLSAVGDIGGAGADPAVAASIAIPIRSVTQLRIALDIPRG